MHKNQNSNSYFISGSLTVIFPTITASNISMCGFMRLGEDLWPIGKQEQFQYL